MNVTDSIEQTTEAVRRACSPEVMTQLEAAEFLEGVMDNLISDLNALREETK